MKDQHSQWIDDNHPRFEQLGHAVTVLLSNILSQRNIEFLSVTFRTKSIDGIREKIRRKSYSNPGKQMTDVAGIRVITYLEDGVAAIEQLIKELFIVDTKNSSDKTRDLGTDRVGYRSRHFVCKLSDQRLSLPEFNGFKDLNFEIQVRTILQHSWAEFSHDRNYKFSEVLPEDITRKLHLYSGLLELADQGFNEIAQQIDQYNSQIAERTEKGDLTLELTTESVYQFTSKKADSIGMRGFKKGDGRKYRRLITELKKFGLSSIEGLDTLFTDEFVNAIRKVGFSSNALGLLRNAMMFEDIHKYLNKAWRKSWSHIGWDAVQMLAQKYPQEELEKIFSSKGIETYDDNEIE